MASIDPVELTAALIRCPTVTPAASPALDLLQRELASLGFTVERPVFQEPGTLPVENLFARLGEGAPHLAFAGHVDVVPPGDRAMWTADPFEAVVHDGRLFGRGAADMKSGVAAFVAAVSDHLARYGQPAGSISLVITGDEEGPSINGTRPLLAWMAERGHRPDACIVGEPTSVETTGDMMKIGRRGSANGRLVVRGRQGHTAYPQRADNAAHRLVAMLHAILATPIDQGTLDFQPTNLQVTSIDIGNAARNVVPAEATALFNIRYNDLQNRDRLEAWLADRCAQVGGEHTLELTSSGDAFVASAGGFVELVADAAASVTGQRPEPSTSGGTSDARFVKDHCPVVELGLVGQTMHQADEHVRVADIVTLTRIYGAILAAWFDPARGG